MNVEIIKNLKEVLYKLGPDQMVRHYKISRLTAPGENYGSLMLRLDIKVINKKTNDEENWNIVAKLLPPNDLLQEVFKVQITFKNEIAFYNKIVPLLEEFQREQGVELADLFPKFYGARISLDPKSKKVDNDAVLLLENLKTSGFTTPDRFQGFDLEVSKLLLKNLAHFHAIPLALKLKKPALFERNIRPYLEDFTFTALEGIAEGITDMLRENEGCVPYIEKAKKLLKQKSVKIVREPFGTITHNDYWVNNVMLRFENGKPTASKMVDFQVIEYKSPCRDLVFFLFSSVQQRVLQENLDYLIAFYYRHFIEKLEELKCDVSLFPKIVLDRELELAARESEYFHLVLMLHPIFIELTDVKELADMSAEDFNLKEVHFSTAYKERLWYVTLEFANRGWLN